jgi:HEAT repeat protein
LYYNDRYKELKGPAGYALTLQPLQKAEDVYIDMITGKNIETANFNAYAIRALGALKSAKAIPAIEAVVRNPPNWYDYYEAYTAYNKIKDVQPLPDIQKALTIMGNAQFGGGINDVMLESARKTLIENKNVILPEVLNIYTFTSKGNINPKGRSALNETIKGMGDAAYPYIKIMLDDSNATVRREAEELLKNIGAETTFSSESKH